MATVAEVQARVKTVRDAYASSVTAAHATGVWTTPEEKQAQQVLATMSTSIEAWATRGSVAATSGATPVGGWANWITGGNGLLQGMQAAIDIGSYGTLDALTTTVAAIPSHAAADVRAGAELAGGVVSAAAGGLFSQVWWIVAVVALGAVGVVAFKGKLVSR